MGIEQVADTMVGVVASRSYTLRLRTQARFHADLLAALPDGAPHALDVQERLQEIVGRLVEVERREEERRSLRFIVWSLVVVVLSASLAFVGLNDGEVDWWAVGGWAGLAICLATLAVLLLWAYFWISVIKALSEDPEYIQALGAEMHATGDALSGPDVPEPPAPGAEGAG